MGPSSRRLLLSILLLVSVLPGTARGQASGELSPDKAVSASRTRAYADALRGFYDNVKPSQAQELAGLLIRESQRHNVDARLVMAVLVAEGNLKRVEQRKTGLHVAGSPAGKHLARLAEDLGAGIRKASPSEPTEAAFRRALEERAKGMSRRVSQRAALVSRELKLYHQMSGHEE